MDKKGMGWGYIVAIVIIIISAVIILGLWLYFGGYLSELIGPTKADLLSSLKS